MADRAGRGTDRRTAIRFATDLPAEILSPEGTPLAAGRLADLSTGGGRIRASVNLKPGDPCRVVFSTDEKTRIAADAVVVYRVDPPSGEPIPPPEIAVRFTRIPQMDKEKIRGYLTRIQRAKYDDFKYSA